MPPSFPHSKERIALALGEFVAVNFLATDVIRVRLKDQDRARALGRQLADPRRSALNRPGFAGGSLS